jgi:asparagine synthase (glutamine-hydrolysing)
VTAIGAIFRAEGVQARQLDALLEGLSANPCDSGDTWSNGPVGLVSCVLHTTAESLTQSQPHSSEDGQRVVVFDGYFANHDDLARDLMSKGSVLRNRSEPELVLRAYEAWGDGFVERLDGEFAFIIADVGSGRIFAARDHLGLRPLFYRLDRGRLIMASDLGAIAALSEDGLEPNTEYLAQVMTNTWFMREATPWRGVKPLLRAHAMSFDGTALKMTQHWSPPTDITIRYKRDEEYVEHYRELLAECVRRASRTQHPLAMAVSGGLDSSSLYSVAHSLEERGDLLAPSIQGYALAAEQGTNAYELPYARAAAAHVGRELIEVPLFDPGIAWYDAQAQKYRDLPIPSNGAMMLGLEQRVVDEGSRVLINGSGGDEWLQGTTQYFREFAADFDLPGFAKALRRDGASFGWPIATREAVRQALAELAPGPLRRAIRRNLRERRRQDRGELFWIAPHLREVLAQAEEDYDAQLPENAIHWVKHNLVKSPFSDLSHTLMRRQRAEVGLESRHPMLSRAFIEFSLQTPAYIKRDGALKKAVHRKAMKGILPLEILERRTKANFTNVKIDMQFAHYVRQHGPELLSEVCDLDGVRRLLEVDFSAPEGDFWAWEIWGLYATAAFLYEGNCVTNNEAVD